jgi:putative tricarboxylic transport membrane protein
MHTTRWGPLAGATGILGIGIAAVIGSLDLGYWKAGPGPGFFPLWLGVLLAGLAAIWLGQLFRPVTVTATAESNSDTEVESTSERERTGGARQTLMTFLGLVALVLLLDPLGYQLAMTLFVLYAMLIVSRCKPIISVVVAVIAGFGVYALFANVLQVYLPTATLGFLAQLGL